MVDQGIAEDVVTFFGALRHTKGHKGQPFVLEPWQRDQIVVPLLATLNEEGLRQYRMAYISKARKNGKSEIGAGLALYLLFMDDEPEVEGYSAAGDRDQAAIVFNQAKSMIEQVPALARRCKIIDSTKRIIVQDTNSVYRVVSADAKTKHGFNAHFVIFDELHTQPNRELFDVLTTSGGTRRQPLVVALTTAGYDEESICAEQYRHAKEVLRDPSLDPSFFAAIWEVDRAADWTDEAIWKDANPALDSFRSREEMRIMFNRALQIPALQNTFRRLYLNQWTEQKERWLDMGAWDAAAGEVDESDLVGERCYAGLDLSSTIDITAFVMVFPDDEGCYDVLARFFIPAEGLHERSIRDKVPYEAWVEQGLVLTTPGNAIDYDFVLEQIDADFERFNIQEVAYDRWGAHEISNRLMDLGLTVIEFGQGFASMNGPMQQLMRLVLSQRLRHGGNQVLDWMAGCMSVKQDPAGNLKPAKPDRQKSGKRIDGIVALLMGLARATVHGESVYDERGLLSFG